jgi:hypothetical protein
MTSLTHSYPASQSRPVSGRSAAALAAAVAAAIAAVAVVSFNGSGASQNAAANPVPSMAALPLSQRLLASGSTSGFVRVVQPTPVSMTTRLQGIGFVSGLNEQLHGLFPLKAQAVSVVERFRSAGGANAELNYQYQQAVKGARSSGLAVSTYRVAGIPGARGWTVRGHGITGINVAYTSGPFYYLVGSGSAPGAHGAPTPNNVAAAANLQYLLVNGCAARGVSAHLA